jgi:hypothetical protein
MPSKKKKGKIDESGAGITPRPALCHAVDPYGRHSMAAQGDSTALRPGKKAAVQNEAVTQVNQDMGGGTVISAHLH